MRLYSRFLLATFFFFLSLTRTKIPVQFDLDAGSSNVWIDVVAENVIIPSGTNVVSISRALAIAPRREAVGRFSRGLDDSRCFRKLHHLRAVRACVRAYMCACSQYAAGREGIRCRDGKTRASLWIV